MHFNLLEIKIDSLPHIAVWSRISFAIWAQFLMAERKAEEDRG